MIHTIDETSRRLMVTTEITRFDRKSLVADRETGTRRELMRLMMFIVGLFFLIMFNQGCAEASNDGPSSSSAHSTTTAASVAPSPEGAATPTGFI